jgi:Protein of unknown function (DUF3617)
MRLFVCLAVAMALAACSPPAAKKDDAAVQPGSGMAAAADTVKPGQWRTTVTVLDFSAAGMPAAALAQMKAGAPMVTTECSTADDVKEFTSKAANRDSNCSVSRMDTGGGRIDGETTCTVEGMTQTVKMSGTYGAERVDMTMDLNMQTPAGLMSQKMQMVSERIGDCPG